MYTVTYKRMYSTRLWQKHFLFETLFSVPIFTVPLKRKNIFLNVKLLIITEPQHEIITGMCFKFNNNNNVPCNEINNPDYKKSKSPIKFVK